MEREIGNIAPRVLSRSEHNVSRKNMDPDAIKVLYRLKNHGYLAYLVGGGVRDLLLERQPKDFDLATSAHPHQVKRLFRNCFVVGRRFRLCHVRFGKKVIEVSTFRRRAEPEEGETLIRHDNTFGSPEEDAFRRDFTINALIYDIATFSVIDWVGGLEDLEARVVRTIGDPSVRFAEDPVRMLRAVAHAARLGFTIDPESVEAIRAMRAEITRSSSARVLEELFKVLRQGAAARTFRSLHELGLLAYLMPEADVALAAGDGALLASLERLDAWRASTQPSIERMSQPVLLGSIFVPLGVSLARGGPGPRKREAGPEEPLDLARELADLGGDERVEPPEPKAEPMSLPVARRDLDRLRLILLAVRRLGDPTTPKSVLRVLTRKAYFDDVLAWLEIHGDPASREAVVAVWEDLASHPEAEGEGAGAAEPRRGKGAAIVAIPGEVPPRKRRRRRRRPAGGRGDSAAKASGGQEVV